MQCRILALLCAGVSLGLTSTAPAAFVGVEAVQVANDYNILTYDIFAHFDGGAPGNLLFAVTGTSDSPLEIGVHCGTFLQHEFGGDRAPSPLFESMPELEFDTFVTIGRAVSIADNTMLAPGWPGFGPDVLAMDNSGWFVAPFQPQSFPGVNGGVLLARLSTLNGHGFYGTMVVNGVSDNLPFDAVVTFDTLPGPGSLALLAVAGCLQRRRRRR